MADIGFLFWPNDTFKRNPYLAGVEITCGFKSISAEPTEPIVLLPTLGGTHIAQGLALDEDDPITRVAYKFDVMLDPEDAEVHFAARRSMIRGSIVNFVPFYWLEESIDAVSGQTYKLSRPPAWGLVPSCDSTSYPASFYLDDVLDPTCASISGQTLTANATGQITIRYLPVFRVKVTPKFSAAEVNGLDTSLTLQEGIVLS